MTDTESMWQPIETAPHDTYCLVYGRKLRWRGAGGVGIGFCHSDYNGHKRVWTLDGRAGPTSRDVEVWAPLPEPPKC